MDREHYKKRYKPVSKKLLINLKDFSVLIDKLEGIIFGSKLAIGHQSLILVSDNNFVSLKEIY
ncbi:esterase-like activity of phytase family protein [Solitalea koreensis]|uniref:esterase-like activity of phytase family protein n=1 Tax=Solitalea koreensis TaxID=543615 RepID=UPI0011597292